jgi:hypothetical protein
VREVVFRTDNLKPMTLLATFQYACFQVASPHHKRVWNWFVAGAQPHGFDFGVIKRSLKSALPTVPAEAVAPKRCHRAYGAVCVDPNDASLQLADHPVRTRQITGKNARRKAKRGVIGERQRFRFGVKP